ncbi:MAG: prephenate dehydrogenase/arogenate dehydrogenase family protein [Candidatus Dormiibacterota bacterium]
MPAVAIVGLGLMGSSLALALKQAQPETVVVGSDPDAMTLRRALDRGIVESASADLSIIDVADIVVVAVPILALKNVLSQLHGHVDGKVITDMASTKETVMEWAAASGIDLVGGHPMCGKEASGINAADASIFKDAPWVLTREDRSVTALVESVGAHPLVMDAATHDRLVAGVSHAAFLLSVGYVLTLSSRTDWPEASKLAASGFRDMSRLAAGDPELYAGISRTNRDHLIDQLDAISGTLAKLRRHLKDDDPRLVELFEDAKSVRERWAKDA